jgi:hypothetical protein
VANDAQLLLLKLDKMQEADQGLIVDYASSEDGTIQYVFIQTSAMRESFAKYPEHVCVDCTYCINDCEMPLLTFLVVDGNNMSRLAAFALLANETAPMLEKIYSTFKSHNSSWPQIQTFMSDKDMTGITKIEEVFPGVKCELCLFHVKQAFRRKLAEYTCLPAVKEQIRLAEERMCEARSEETYEEWKAKLSTLDEEFNSYFQ